MCRSQCLLVAYSQTNGKINISIFHLTMKNCFRLLILHFTPLTLDSQIFMSGFLASDINVLERVCRNVILFLADCRIWKAESKQDPHSLLKHCVQQVTFSLNLLSTRINIFYFTCFFYVTYFLTMIVMIV